MEMEQFLILLKFSCIFEKEISKTKRYKTNQIGMKHDSNILIQKKNLKNLNEKYSVRSIETKWNSAIFDCT